MPRKKRKKKKCSGRYFINFILFISVLAFVFPFLFIAAGANFGFFNYFEASDVKNVSAALVRSSGLEKGEDKNAVVGWEEKDFAYLEKVKDIFENFTATGSISIGQPEGEVVVRGVSFLNRDLVDFSYSGGPNQYMARGKFSDNGLQNQLDDIFIIFKNNFKY